MKNDIFLADSLIVQELAFSCLIDSIFKFHPELRADFINQLEYALNNLAIPTAGARQNLKMMIDGLKSNQPNPPTVN